MLGETSITASGRCSSSARKRDSRPRTMSSSSVPDTWPAHAPRRAAPDPRRGRAGTLVGARTTERVVVGAVGHHGDGEAGIGALHASDAQHERLGFDQRIDDEGGRVGRLDILGGEAGESFRREAHLPEARAEPGHEVLAQRVGRTRVPETLRATEHVALGVPHLVEALGQRSRHQCGGRDHIIGSAQTTAAPASRADGSGTTTSTGMVLLTRRTRATPSTTAVP